MRAAMSEERAARPRPASCGRGLESRPELGATGCRWLALRGQVAALMARGRG